MSAKKSQNSSRRKIFIHPTAEVDSKVKIGDGTKIWHLAQIRERAVIGKNCVIGKGVYIDCGVVIEDFVKVENYSCLYKGVMVEDGAFIGSGVLFATDLNPRSQTVIGGLKKREDWILSPILVGQGVSVGSGAVILGGVKIGKFSLIGAGSIVTKDVCEHGLVRGNPAKLAGFVCQCGYKGILVELTKDDALLKCSHCQIRFSIKRTFWDNVRKNLLLKNE